MRLHNWLFGRIYMNEETGDGGGGGGGVDTSSSSDTSTSSSNEPATPVEPASTEPAETKVTQKAETDEPKSMLEAIEKGLGKVDDPKKEDGKTAEVKPVGEDKGKPPEQKEDDPLKMPEGLHVKAQERFQRMVTMVKEKDQQIEQLRTSGESATKAATALGNFIKETGATADQFSMMSQYLKAANSGDVETEYNILVGRLREIQMQTGRTFDNLGQQADPLQQFPDLAQAVAAYQITREHAMELARARGQQQQQQQVTQQQHEQQAEAQHWIQAKDATINTIRDWERQMAASDPDYQQVSAVMRQNKNALEWVVRNTPPDQWKHHMTMLYNQTKAARQAWAPQQTQAPRPLSGSGGKPQGTGKAPTTMFDAMFPNG